MRGEQQNECSASLAAAAGGGFSAFRLTTKQQHTNDSNLMSHSIINGGSNGAVFMNA